MAINWKTRIKHKAFWLSIIPAVLLLVQAAAEPFGYNWDFIVLNQQLAGIVNALFAIMAIVGIPVDMTTEGLSDSYRALTYEEPAPVAPIDEEE
ncbi:MAG: phage holin [Bacteroidales bacterium]|nr:phage holin [Candidatus Colimorpha merdihippi]